MTELKRLLVVSLLILALATGLWWITSQFGTESSSTTYTVEVVPADPDETNVVVEFSELNQTEQQQFERSLDTVREYKDKPALVEYAGEQIRYQGEVYSVVVTVP